VRQRKAPEPDFDGDRDEEYEERPVARKKFRKKKKRVDRTPLVVGSILGGVLVVGLGGIFAAVIWSQRNKAATVADNNSSKSDSDRKSGPEPGSGSVGAGRSRPEMPPSNIPRDNPTPPGLGGQTGQGGASGRQDFSVGKSVFNNNCARCHSIGGASAEGPGRGNGGPGGGRNRGPDLSKVGRDPSHTVDWLMAFVREPTSKKPRSRMPGFDGKIAEADLRALAEYLASLK
jgi:mono/diheme cytochrome c family protein